MRTGAESKRDRVQAAWPGLPQLRPVGDADQEFLLELYRFTHGPLHEELASISADAAKTLLHLQVRAQFANCRQRFPESHFQIICAPGGGSAGRLTTARTATYLHLLHIGLLPAFCGHGWGTHLLVALQQDAAAARIPLHLAVSRSNRAQNLFRRMGFTVTTQHERDIGMTWFPPDKSRYSPQCETHPHG